MQVDLSREELLLARAALMLVSPAGGMTPQSKLRFKLANLNCDPEMDREELELTRKFADIVNAEAAEHGEVLIVES